MERNGRILKLDGVEYLPCEYMDEETLEHDVISNIRSIFGENAIYIPKLKITPLAGTSRIPDLYVIDIAGQKSYVIEVERISHSIPDHIAPQIAGFYRILTDSSSKGKLVEGVYEKITQDTKLENAFKDKGIREIHKSITDVLTKNHEVVLIIDKVTEELEYAIQSLNRNTLILEFKRYKRYDADVFIYEIETLPNKSFVNINTTGSFVSMTPVPNEEMNDLLKPGTKIYANYLRKLYTCTIEQNNKIKFDDGSLENSLSSAARRITKNSVNGWVFWHKDKECEIPLAEVRKKHRGI